MSRFILTPHYNDILYDSISSDQITFALTVEGEAEHDPSNIVAKYDTNKNGCIDSGEWVKAATDYGNKLLNNKEILTINSTRCHFR